MENLNPSFIAAPATTPSRPSARRGPSRRFAEGLTALAAALLFGAPGWAAPTPPQLQLSREGHVFRLQASFEARAPRAAAWEVLTDYDGMTKFVSSLKESRVASRAPDSLVIEQEGVVRVAMFSRRVPVKLKVVERAPERIEFSAVDDRQFEEYEGAWSIVSSSNTSVVTYQLFAEMKPSLVPRSLARRILEKSIRSQLEQVQAEIERRAGVLPP